ncbi:MAG: superoxide dismutase family protein [Lawsonibacter sp.]|nr:superoxide dismutase family protein [Lawsonibacter sp.]
MNQFSFCSNSKLHLLSVLRSRPTAVARMAGSESCPDILGVVRFYQINEGVIVWAEVNGLPLPERPCQERVFGFHIHKGTDCKGNMDDPFADAMSHYDLSGCEHPYHAGDLPPLFGNNGFALSIFLTDRFSVKEVIGRTVIIHDHPDDFATQPSGNSGTKIACGVICSATGTCR